jgi:two-component system, response regulator
MTELDRIDLKGMLSRFGSAIRAHRKRLGFSQEELADRSGLHRTYITDVERGVRNVTMESMCKLIGALDVPFTTIFNDMEQTGERRDGTGGSSRASGKAVEILLVEDNPTHADHILQALKKHGVINRVLSVHSGEEALRVLQQDGGSAPDMILLDLTLTESSSVEVVRRLRSSERTRSIPVVLLLDPDADPGHVEHVRSELTGAISKPVDFAEFSSLMPKFGFSWLLMEHE